MRFLLAVAALCLAGSAVADVIPFSTCGDGDIVPATVDLSPNPPVPGQDLVISATGTLAKDLLDGTFQLDLALLGITVYSQKGDICTFSPETLACPQAAGDVAIKYTVNVPSIAPSGTYTATFKAARGDGSALFCVKASVAIKKQSNEVLVHNEEIINEINSKTNLWKAGASKRFLGATREDLKKLMGVLPGGPILEEKVFPKYVTMIDAPETFDAREQWGSICPSLNEIRDQGSCGSCWAVAAAAAMTDRLCIQSNGAHLIHLSSQDLTSCCGFLTCGFGCNGGYPSGAWSYFKSTGLVSGGEYNTKQGCYPYEIASCDHHVNGTHGTCSDSVSTPSCKSTCQNTADFKGDKTKSSKAYSVSSKVAEIQAEILQYGPVEASFTVYDDFVNYKSGVYHHVTGSALGGHAVKIFGWGVEDGTPYWLVANSWNEEWGDNGTFKIRRGSNECGIEGQITAGIMA